MRKPFDPKKTARIIVILAVYSVPPLLFGTFGVVLALRVLLWGGVILSGTIMTVGALPLFIWLIVGIGSLWASLELRRGDLIALSSFIILAPIIVSGFNLWVLSLGP